MVAIEPQWYTTSNVQSQKELRFYRLARHFGRIEMKKWTVNLKIVVTTDGADTIETSVSSRLLADDEKVPIEVANAVQDALIRTVESIETLILTEITEAEA
jgi:hypothetical protein